jgi:hypothetical protein
MISRVEAGKLMNETICTAVATAQVRNTSKSVLNTDTKTAVEKSGVVGLETMTNLKTSQESS